MSSFDMGFKVTARCVVDHDKIPWINAFVDPVVGLAFVADKRIDYMFASRNLI